MARRLLVKYRVIFAFSFTLSNKVPDKYGTIKNKTLTNIFTYEKRNLFYMDLKFGK